MDGNRLSPFVNGIEHHQMCLFLQIAYLLFSYAVLKMSIYTTIGDVLLLGSTMIDEPIICKPPVISMIVFHYHTACFGHPLETLLAFNSFITGQCSLEMDTVNCKNWLTYTVAYLYLAVVNLPFSCAMNPAIQLIH